VAEMGAAGSSAHVHVAALFDTYAGPARIIYVTPGGYDVLSEEGELDMSDWQVLRDFGVWAVEHFPARHHALILWNHGSGWAKGGAPALPILKGFSSDDHGAAGEISVARGDYARALAGITAALGGRLDIVGFDACLMGMWEVAHESAPYADYLIASEETEPGAGWPYDGFLPGLVEQPAMTPLALASAVVEAYFLADPGNSTLSVVDLATAGDLEAALSALADAAMAHPEHRAAIRAAAEDAQGFTGVSRDLGDFAARLSADPALPPEVRAAAQALVDQLAVSVVYSRAQADYPGAHGLAAYLPTWGVEPDYAGAPWAAGSRWDEFLIWLNP